MWLLLLVALLAGCATNSDEAFLDHLERGSFAFFWEQADPTTGLIADRARADGSNHPRVASIASVGFGLSSICIADQRGWVPHDRAYERTLATLRFLWSGLPNEHGFYYHWVDMHTGARDWGCEVSSVDTALLMAGVVTAGDYYYGTEVERLARRIYERVDWPWMLNGDRTLSMGWTPERGFLGDRWNEFCEGQLIYLLALGSPTHPLEPACWSAWKREPVITYGGWTYVQCPPLFTHQYPQAWFDLRNKRDAFVDYWHNSELATRAQRQFCIDLHTRFPAYGENIWGITASDSAGGYKSWGGPPVSPDIDGTVVPCAAGGSIPFAPTECVAALKEMRVRYGDRIWKRYGFADAFNPQTGWIDPDVIGVDVGITLLMAENQRTGFVWREFMANPAMRRALMLAGFRSTGSPQEHGDGRLAHAAVKAASGQYVSVYDPRPSPLDPRSTSN